MSDWQVRDTKTGNVTDPLPSKSDAQDRRAELDGPDVAEDRFAVEPVGETDGGAEVVETAEPDDVLEPDEILVAVQNDPIGTLESINSDFTNTVKGTPSISKQGFRFLASKLNISTETEVVETFDDPLGVVVWARAEGPDGRVAEAHGEGYKFETRLDDNEFVRYADTRAKNRAISDLTAAGELAASELRGGGGD